MNTIQQALRLLNESRQSKPTNSKINESKAKKQRRMTEALNTDSEFDAAEYAETADQFVADICDPSQTSDAEVKELYYSTYGFDANPAEDEVEEKIQKALEKRLAKCSVREDFNEEDEYSSADAAEFADEILNNMPMEDVENYYYNEYQFDKHPADDEDEEIIATALMRRLGLDDDVLDDEDETFDDGLGEQLDESVDNSSPVTLLGESTVIDYVLNKVKRGGFLSVGYLTEINPAAKFKFKEGRPTSDNPDFPVVRIFKALEYYGRCGIDYENKKDVITMRAETGKEHVGSWYTIEDNGKLFKAKASGKEGIAIYGQKGKLPRVKYFISLNDEDLHECSVSDITPYLTASDVKKLTERPTATYTTADGEVKDAPQAPNCLYASKIYYIGTDSHGKIGNSIVR